LIQKNISTSTPLAVKLSTIIDQIIKKIKNTTHKFKILKKLSLNMKIKFVKMELYNMLELEMEKQLH
jgi:hypothetical protein